MFESKLLNSYFYDSQDFNELDNFKNQTMMFTCEKLDDLRRQGPHDKARPRKPRYIEIVSVLDPALNKSGEIKRLLWPGDIVALQMPERVGCYAVWTDQHNCVLSHCLVTRWRTLAIWPDPSVDDAVDWYSEVVKHLDSVCLTVKHTDAGLRWFGGGRTVPAWSKVTLEFSKGFLLRVWCNVPAYADGGQSTDNFSSTSVSAAIDYQREELDMPRAYLVAVYKAKPTREARIATTWSPCNDVFVVENCPTAPLNNLAVMQYSGKWSFRRDMLANIELTNPEKILRAPADHYFNDDALRKGIIQYTPVIGATKRFACCYETLVNVTLALHKLPSYVLLWITELLPCMPYWVALRRLRAIEGVQASIKAIIEKRRVRDQ